MKRLRDAWEVLRGRKVAVEPARGGFATGGFVASGNTLGQYGSYTIQSGPFTWR